MPLPRDRANRPALPGSAVGAGRGVLAVAATYTFFLLWVQYGFLDLLQARLAGPAEVRGAMAVMGVAGLAASLAIGGLLGKLADGAARRRVLPAGFALCAVAAPAGLAARGPLALAATAGLLGVATALVTVPLAADLRRLLPGRRFGGAVGLGTGLAYLVCNLPALFEGPPAVQAWFVAAVCALAAVLVRPAPEDAPGAGSDEETRATLPRRAFRRPGFGAVVVAFLALVWLDSAAFAVIQESAALKGVSWAGAAHTLTQGGVHLLAAVAAGLAVDAGLLVLLPAAAFGLFVAALPLLSGAGAAPVGGLAALAAAPAGGLAALAAAPLYAAGISLYSVALVAYPAARGDEAGLVPRRWRAAILFGVAGWLGSALGVGMAQDLHRIPGAFLAAAGGAMAVAVGLAWSKTKPVGGGGRRLLRLLAGPLVFATAAVVWQAASTRDAGAGHLAPPLVEGFVARSPAAARPDDPAAVARGRRVYVGEGCVHCHSQYVRPGGPDVELWGPYRPLDRDERPPLVGNRRQGPDLANVGNRRHPEWQRAHLLDPRALVPGSRMPSYAHLFAAGDTRGDDLVAYLASLGRGTGEARWRTVSAWPEEPLPAGSSARGAVAFQRWCAACHGSGGGGDGPLADRLRRPGMDLGKGSFWLVSWSGSPSGGDAEARRELDVQLARLVRFGAAGSPMPGHEWLTLQEVSDVVAFVHTLTGEDASASKGTAAAGGLAAPPRRIATAAAEPLRRRTASPSPAGGPTPRFHAAGLVSASWPAAALAGLALLGLGAAAFTGWLAPPRPWREATGWADIPAAERAPVSAAPWPAGTAAGPPPRLTWLGHAGFLVEWEGTRLLLDPNSSARCTVARRVLAERVDPGELGRVDAALISHAHYDHLDLATLAAVPELAAVVVPAGSERYLAALDPEVRRVGLRPGERFRVGSLEVVAVPAQHNGHRFHPLASGHGAAGYVVRGSRSALFYAGDTGYGPHLAAIGARWRPRLAILPIGAFAPRVPLRRYHLSPEEAVRAADDLGAEVVVPAHFGTYRLSLDAPDAALPRFAAAAAAAGQRWVLAPPPEGGG